MGSNAGEIKYNLQPETHFPITLLPLLPALPSLPSLPSWNALNNRNVATDAPVIGVDHPTEPGEVMFFKEATPVPGMLNTWNITL